MNLPKIIMPRQPRNNIHNHCNDTFRELVQLWYQRGYCQIELSDSPYVWWNKVGDILLYDFDISTPNFFLSNTTYNLGLFGNGELPKNGKKNVLWIYWGRRPILMDNKLKSWVYQNFNERKIISIFLGKVENNVQLQYRAKENWSDVIEVFHMPIRGEYKYNQSEYLDLIAQSRFGLCLRGYGPKCNREIELLAFGTVLLITPNVDVSNYYEPLIENIHYLSIKEPSDVKKVIDECSEETWREMSKNCMEWYNRNCSTENSFKLTNKIIDMYS